MCTPCAGERIEVRGQRRHQRLAFAGAHLGDLAVVQRDAADQLHVEVAHVERALAGFAHHGERFGQQLLERFLARAVERSVLRASASRLPPRSASRRRPGRLREPLLDALPELVGLRAQLGVGELRDLRLERVDRAHRAAVLLEQPVVAAAEDLS